MNCGRELKPLPRVPAPREVVQHDTFRDDDEARVLGHRCLDHLQGLVHDRTDIPDVDVKRIEGIRTAAHEEVHVAISSPGH